MALPSILSQRMARFFMDSASASSASGGNLLDLGLDSNTILTVNVVLHNEISLEKL